MKWKPEFIPLTPDWKSSLLFLVLSSLRLEFIYPLKHEILGLMFSTSGLNLGFKEPRRLLTKRMLQAAHSRGRKVFVFGFDLNDKKYLKAAIQLGVDGIFTDEPQLLRQCIDEIAKKDTKKEEEEEQNKELGELKEFGAFDILVLLKVVLVFVWLSLTNGFKGSKQQYFVQKH